MSKVTPAIFKAIRDRLAGDATLVALLAGGSANAITFQIPQPAIDPPTSQYPRVVLRFLGIERDETFQTRRYVYTFEVHSFVREEGTSGESTTLTLAKIDERIMGDWPESGGAPTYGLDRWNAQTAITAQIGDFSTTFKVETMLHIATTNASDDGSGVREWVQTYRVGLDLTQT